MDVIKSS